MGCQCPAARPCECVAGHASDPATRPRTTVELCGDAAMRPLTAPAAPAASPHTPPTGRRAQMRVSVGSGRGVSVHWVFPVRTCPPPVSAPGVHAHALLAFTDVQMLCLQAAALAHLNTAAAVAADGAVATILNPVQGTGRSSPCAMMACSACSTDRSAACGISHLHGLLGQAPEDAPRRHVAGPWCTAAPPRGGAAVHRMLYYKTCVVRVHYAGGCCGKGLVDAPWLAAPP